MAISTINILMADDDEDDRYFFAKSLKNLPISTHFMAVNHGEQLMKYLIKNKKTLPQVLFLDINMPRKNGYECLSEIKSDKGLCDLPVVIYSTALREEMADLLYNGGAHYYLKKCDPSELVTYLQPLLSMLKDGIFLRPSRDEFILNHTKAHV